MRRTLIITASLAACSLSGCAGWMPWNNNSAHEQSRAPQYSLKPADIEEGERNSFAREYNQSDAHTFDAGPSISTDPFFKLARRVEPEQQSDLLQRKSSDDSSVDANPDVFRSTFGMGFSEAEPTPGRPVQPGRFDSPNVSQVTFSSVGAVFDPAISPDGEFLVFAGTQHNETADLYMKKTNSRVLTQLTTDPGQDAMPTVSPDGSRIAFCSDRDGQWDIYVMPMGGGAAVRITNDPAHELHPSWSPDGSRLVFSRLGRVSGRWELWVTDLAQRPVTHFIGYGLFPNWCPVPGTGTDGADRILFQRSRQRGDMAFGVWTMDFKNDFAGNLTEIASAGDAAYINPAWSPEGDRIVFAAVPNDGSWNTNRRPSSVNLYMTDVEGFEMVKLTDGATADLMPTWAPDGTLYFASDRGDAENLWSLNITPAVQLAESMRVTDTDLASADTDN